MLKQLVSYFSKRRGKKLIQAAEDGRLDLVRRLLQAGANPNFKSEGNITVLMWAAARGHLEVVKVLLKAGADLSARTQRGRTAIDLATQEGHDSLAAFLLENDEVGGDGQGTGECQDDDQTRATCKNTGHPNTKQTEAS